MHGVEDLFDGEIKERRIGGFTALVGSNGIGAAQNNLVGGIRPVAGRVGGAEEGNGGSSEGHSKMKRARVSTDDADGVAQESHELAEFSIVNEGLRIAAGSFDGRDERVFAGTIVDDAANSQRGADFLAQLAKAVSGPAFGAPAAAGAEDDVTRRAILGQLFADESLVGSRDSEKDIRHCHGCAGAEREFTILIGDVLSTTEYPIGVKNWYAVLAHR